MSTASPDFTLPFPEGRRLSPRCYICRPRADVWVRVVFDPGDTRLSFWPADTLSIRVGGGVSSYPSLQPPLSVENDTLLITALIYDFLQNNPEGNNHGNRKNRTL